MESWDCADGTPEAASPNASISAEDGVNVTRCGGLRKFPLVSSSEGGTGESSRYSCDETVVDGESKPRMARPLLLLSLAIG